jgi:large subunit ribosomal protein L4
MANAKLFGADGAFSKEIELPETHFEAEISKGCIYYAVKAYLGNQRQGTHMAKNRALVNGTGAKPWKQKGTGRARAGSSKSPIWVRGGKAHPPEPRSYRSKVNKKVKQKAFLSALSVKAQEEKVFVFEKLSFEAPKTKDFLDIITKAGLANEKALVLVTSEDLNVLKASGNVHWTNVMRVQDANTYEVLRATNVVFTQNALASLSKEASK